MSKSTVVSKREKMKAKREGKNIISLIQEIEPVIEPPRPQSQIIPVSNPRQDEYIVEEPPKRKYNTFNFDVMKKYTLPTSAMNQQQPLFWKTLQIGESNEKIQKNSYQGRTLFMYKTKGANSVKHISENHLKNRVNTFIEEENNANVGQQTQVNGEKQPTQNKNKNFLRYFENKQQKFSDDEEEKPEIVKCYRCGERGHIARNCYQEAEKVKCLFCLGEHHHSQCTDKLCFRCNQTGHISQYCRKSGIKCRKCRKVGHIEKDCGSIMMLDYVRTTQKQIRQRYQQGDLKKLKCLRKCEDRFGHFNCFEYGKKIVNVYNDKRRK